ncbi:MAG: hypothetical protein K0U36_06770 [Alphaproteobacteria bacterium]|nr:hypothetical protein [Alphaproteobacteria bacterium]
MTAAPPVAYRAEKRLGQHFLHDSSIVESIVDACQHVIAAQQETDHAPSLDSATATTATNCEHRGTSKTDGDNDGVADRAPCHAIVEIGCGQGALTKSLVALAKPAGLPLIAVDIDQRAESAIDHISDATFVLADATTVMPWSISAAMTATRLGQASTQTNEGTSDDPLNAPSCRGGRPLVVGNLPYNVGTKMLLAWMASPAKCLGFVVMVQAEVAARMLAPPHLPKRRRTSNGDHACENTPPPTPPTPPHLPPSGQPPATAEQGATRQSKDAFKILTQRDAAMPRSFARRMERGALSVLVQAQADWFYWLDVAPDAFDPPPKVQSTVLVGIPKRDPLSAEQWQQLQNTMATGFAQRRQTLKKKFPHARLEQAGIDSSMRAEELTNSDWMRLSGLVDTSVLPRCPTSHG